MIDYIKILLFGANVSELRKNQYLNFFTKVNLDTGEVKNGGRNGKQRTPSEEAEYKGLTFVIYESGSVFIKGSLHKYWNDGEHNYNDFTLVDMLEVLNDIQEKFNIHPSQMILKCIELGVNIKPPHAFVDILKYCFLHGTKMFRWCNVRKEGRYIQAEHSQYLIKIYDKARQYRARGFDINDEILRFEIKYLKLEKLKRLGIVTIQDLIDYDLGKFVPMLVAEWKKILFYDPTIKSNSKCLPNYKNPIYWQGLTERKTKASLKKHKLKLSKLIVEGSKNISLQISNLIEVKGKELTRGIHIDQNMQQENIQEGIHIDQNVKKVKRCKGIHIDPLIILSIPIPFENYDRLCEVTGLPLFNQKENSSMLSHTGLYFYQKNYPEIFKMLKQKYLTDFWKESELKKHIEIIAHNIRVTKWNFERKKKRLYPKDNYRMFEISGK